VSNFVFAKRLQNIQIIVLQEIGSGISKKDIDPRLASEKNMTSDRLLSLDRVTLIDIQSAMVTLSTGAHSEQVCWYSVNRGPIQERPPVIVQPCRPVLMCVTLFGQGRGFQPGRNEFTFGTLDGHEYSFEYVL
jgi:hypothetical protein